MGDLSVFHKESSITRHSCEDLLVGIHFADIPQPGNQNAALGPGYHLVHALLISWRDENHIDGSFADLIRQREAVAGFGDRAYFTRVLRLSHFFCRTAGIDQVLDYSLFHQAHALSADALSIKRSIRLKRMVHIVHNADVGTEKLCSNAIV